MSPSLRSRAAAAKVAGDDDVDLADRLAAALADAVTDPRPRAALSKPVNLAQLADEVGAALCASEREVVVADPEAKATTATLTAAVAAHVPNPDWGRPAEDVALSAIRAKAQEVAAGTGTFSPAQMQKILAHLVLRSTR